MKNMEEIADVGLVFIRLEQVSQTNLYKGKEIALQFINILLIL